VLFTSNANGTFIYSSPTMEGEWRKTVVYNAPYNPTQDRLDPLQEQDLGDGFSHHVLYDPGFLVDNDGRVYVFHGNTYIYLTELAPVSLQPLGQAKPIFKAHRLGLEGNRPYHIGDYYYLICTYGGSHSGNVTCLRSRSLEGPWEEREVMCAGARLDDMHILQTCLIPMKNGDTWAMGFLDMGALGRIPHLVPVNWMDGWPVLGDWANGNLTLPKPLTSAKKEVFATSDDFTSNTLGLQWQFNHNPDLSKYSLTQRKGWLRMHATQPVLFSMRSDVSPGSSIDVSPEAPFLMVRNVLTQRLFGPRCEITAKVDVSHLKTDDKAGLALLNIPYATLTISRQGKRLTLQQTKGDNQSETAVSESVPLRSKDLWLRVKADGQKGLADFSYSLDGTTYHPLGQTFQMVYAGNFFVGNRVALFCYNAKHSGGWLDIDDFKVDISPLFNRHVSTGTTLEAEWTDALWRTECREQGVAWTGDGGLIKFSRMHFSDDISQAVFHLRNINTEHAFIELSDEVSGEILGQADIPTTGKQEVEMTLHKPLSKVKTLTIRIWNHDWDVPKLDEVLLDKITFK
jgi:beta-xylosidase